MLRALHEAGVKLDVAAGRGISAIGALFAAVDGAPSLWTTRVSGEVPSFVVSTAGERRCAMLAWSVAAAAVVSIPVAAVALGLVVYPIDFILKMVGLSGSGLVGWYLEVAQAAFAPTGLPTWLPRIALLILGGATAAAAVIAAQRPRPRQTRGQWWWHLADAPLTAELAVAHAWGAVWDLVRGAAQPRLPSRVDLAGATRNSLPTTSASRAFVNSCSWCTTSTLAAIWSSRWSVRQDGAIWSGVR